MPTVTYNVDRAGIEIRFDAKPDQPTLDTLRANGFRWSHRGFWYAKDTADRRTFVESITDAPAETIDAATYPAIDIDDVHTYTIDAKLQRAEHDSRWLLRTREPDRTAEIQKHFQHYTDAVHAICATTDDQHVMYALKSALQRYKRKYHENQIAYLRHRANNPSWIVTGRAGRNPRRDEKANNREHILITTSLELTKQMDDALERAHDMIRRNKEQRTRQQMEQTQVDIEFTAQMQYVELRGYVDRCRTYTHGEYMIAKTWGCYRIFRNGVKIHSMKTRDKLDDAKKYVAMLVHQENN